MLSLKDTRDFLLLSYDMKLIKDDEFGHVRLVHQSLIVPYDSFPPFDLSQLNEYECSVKLFFRSQRTGYCLLFFRCQPSLIK